MPPHLPSRGRAQQHCLLIGRMGGDVLERLTCHYNTPARLVCCTPPRGSGVACRRICCFGSESHAAATPRPVCADTHRRAGAGWLAAEFAVSEAILSPPQHPSPFMRMHAAAWARIAYRRICCFGSESRATTTPRPIWKDAHRHVKVKDMPPNRPRPSSNRALPRISTSTPAYAHRRSPLSAPRSTVIPRPGSSAPP